MADRVVLGTNRKNFNDCLTLAIEKGVGLELQAFAYPDTLDSDWEGLVNIYQQALKGLAGEVTMHGPFIDMASGTTDPLIRNVVRRRVSHALEIASILEVRTVVFHANYIASMRNEVYRLEWTEREVYFWGEISERAEELGLTLALENMWEFSPNLIGEVLLQVNSPALRACLDVGHAILFSKLGLDAWLTAMSPYLVHLHINNTLGEIDEHRALDDGVIDYAKILPKLRKLPLAPSICLEIDGVEELRRSLPFMHLADPAGSVAR